MMRRFLSVAALITAIAAALLGTTWQAAASPRLAPQQPIDLRARDHRPAQREGRMVLDGISANLMPNAANRWDCACDTDGCYPGCFPIAAATVMEYWSQRGYPTLWDADAASLLAELRGLFPNLFCYDNVDSDGRPGESGFEAFDVAHGLDMFVRQRGFRFRIRAVPAPTFELVVAEIDAGRPVIGAFSRSPWGSHAGTIIGYDATDGKRVLVVRPNLPGKPDTDLTWGVGYSDFGIITIEPTLDPSDLAPRTHRDIEVLVDDGDPGFSLTGDWQSEFGVGISFGDGARWIRTITTTDENAVAAWTPQLPYDGIYEVQAHLPRQDDDDSHSRLVTYRVRHAEGASFVRRSQHDARAGWIPLGNFPFISSSSHDVQLGNGADEIPSRLLWADAVRFIYRGPLVLRRGADGPLGLVIDGQMRRLQDSDSLDVLHLPRTAVRTVDDIEFTQYPPGAPLPSMYAEWVGQYFDNDRLALPATAVDSASAVDFAWGDIAPADGLIPSAFSVRWSRTMALTEGDYPFILEAAGRVRLWVDGKLEIDAWTAEPGVFQRHEKLVALLTGLHRIDIEYAPRGGDARLRLDNLPPAAPVVLTDFTTQQTTSEVVLSWTDGGDPDGSEIGRPRRFFATLWNDAGYQVTSGWIGKTEWRRRLPSSGRYFWNVIATDGTANSAASPTRAILFDGEAPWAQMLAAHMPVGHADLSTVSGAARLRLATNTNGTQVVVDAGIDAELESVKDAPAPNRPIILDRALYRRFGNAPVARLTWWATDTLSMQDMRFALQAREIMQARTVYSITTVEHEVTRTGLELLIHNTQEITRPVTFTETVVYTDVTPTLSLTPIDAAEWITIGDGLDVTSTVFVGYPGSTYEFRVRATDGMGNEQSWYDGYSLQVKLDETSVLTNGLIPLTLFFDEDGKLIPAQPLPTPQVTPTPAVITTTVVMTSPFMAPIEAMSTTQTITTASTTDVLLPMPTIMIGPEAPYTPTPFFGLATMPAYEPPPTQMIAPTPTPTPQITPTPIPLP